MILDEGGLDPALVQELAREAGGKTLPCPSCAQAMSPVTLRGTDLDICFPCGVTFLDEGELARFSSGRHEEHAPPPSRVRMTDQLATLDTSEPPPDPRATWEKGLPVYVLQAWGMWLLTLAKGWGSSPLVGVGVALGVVSVPLGLSTLVNMDLRQLFHPGFRWSWSSRGYRNVGAGAVVLFIVALFFGGLLSTLNAMIAERFPRVFSTRNALYGLGALLVAGVVLTILG